MPKVIGTRIVIFSVYQRQFPRDGFISRSFGQVLSCMKLLSPMKRCVFPPASPFCVFRFSWTVVNRARIYCSGTDAVTRAIHVLRSIVRRSRPTCSLRSQSRAATAEKRRIQIPIGHRRPCRYGEPRKRDCCPLVPCAQPIPWNSVEDFPLAPRCIFYENLLSVLLCAVPRRTKNTSAGGT